MLPDIVFSPVAVAGCAINVIIAAVCFYVRRYRGGRDWLSFFAAAHLAGGVAYLMIVPVSARHPLSETLDSPLGYLVSFAVIATASGSVAGALRLLHGLRVGRFYAAMVISFSLIVLAIGSLLGPYQAFRIIMVVNVVMALVAGGLFLRGRTAFYRLTGVSWLLRACMVLALALLPATPLGQQYFLTVGVLNVIFIAATGFGIILIELDDARQAAADASAAKSQFIANMSHELRTPLNAIIGFAELVEGRAFVPTQSQTQHYGGLILQAGRHLLGLVNTLLDMASIEAGRENLVPEPVAADLLAGECVKMLEGDAALADISLRLTAVPVTAMADPRALRQILIILIGNAIKFSPADSRVEIAVSRNAGQAWIRVADQGPGMPAEQLARIFEPFFQGGDTYSRAKGGLGLGLAIARRLAAALRGSIAVDSRPGAGSAFTLILPRADVAATLEAGRQGATAIVPGGPT